MIDSKRVFLARTRFGQSYRRVSRNTRRLAFEHAFLFAMFNALQISYWFPSLPSLPVADFLTLISEVKSANDAFEKHIKQHQTWQGHSIIPPSGPEVCPIDVNFSSPTY